jgi:4-hydroxybenzoate polyprenyltransferase
VDAKAILDSAAGGWWYPAVVVGVVLASAIWKAFHFNPDRPGETILPVPVLTGGAVLAAVPFFGQLLVHGTMPEPAPGLFLLVFLAAMSLATSLKQQLRETDRRPPQP